HFPDPFVELTAAAAVTQELKVGTAVCLLTEHHPITLAKTVATLDRVSSGRFLFGIGGGWNVEEMANHGVEVKDRWTGTREFVLAMRAIWSSPEAEFHGKFVDFERIWSWPKPVQKGGPPVLLGVGATKAMPRRLIEYCNGWMPLDGINDVVAGIASLRGEAERAGRALEDFDLSVLTGFGGFEATSMGKKSAGAKPTGIPADPPRPRTWQSRHAVVPAGSIRAPPEAVSVISKKRPRTPCA